MTTKSSISLAKKAPTKSVAAKKAPSKPVNLSPIATKVGVVGLGIMGSSIATNLHTSGFSVFGFDPSKEQQKLLKKVGITICQQVSDVAKECDFLLLSLPSVYALKAVSEEIAANAKKGTIVAELGTLPHDAKETARALLATKGIILLDCPLSGTGAQAKTRDLAVYASGDKTAITKMDPVFEGFARARYNVGEFGQGMKMKLVANHLVAIHNVAAAEAILLGAEMGLDANQVVEVIGDGAGSSRMFQVRGPSMANRTWHEATMKIEVWAKDMHLIGEAIKSYNVPAPLFSSCMPIYHAAAALGHQKDDTAVVYKVLENWSTSANKAPVKTKKVSKSK